MKTQHIKDQDPMYPSKKCPECYTYIPLDALICPYCATRVGKIEAGGMASRRTNWKTNIVCIVTWLIFFLFIKYAFF